MSSLGEPAVRLSKEQKSRMNQTTRQTDGSVDRTMENNSGISYDFVYNKLVNDMVYNSDSSLYLKYSNAILSFNRRKRKGITVNNSVMLGDVAQILIPFGRIF